MTITLTSAQVAWIESHVANGDFTSVEEAARKLIDDGIAQLSSVEEDDMAWAAPLVEEAREAIARGEIMTLEEHRARNAARRAAHRP